MPPALGPPAADAPPAAQPAQPAQFAYLVALGDLAAKVRWPKSLASVCGDLRGERISDSDLVGKGARVQAEQLENEASGACAKYLVVAPSARSFGRARFRGKAPDPTTRGFDLSVRRSISSVLRLLPEWKALIVLPSSNGFLCRTPWSSRVSAGGVWKHARLDAHLFGGLAGHSLTIALNNFCV